MHSVPFALPRCFAAMSCCWVVAMLAHDLLARDLLVRGLLAIVHFAIGLLAIGCPDSLPECEHPASLVSLDSASLARPADILPEDRHFVDRRAVAVQLDMHSVAVQLDMHPGNMQDVQQRHILAQVGRSERVEYRQRVGQQAQTDHLQRAVRLQQAQVEHLQQVEQATQTAIQKLVAY